ncbi:uncharacterized protein BO80DRAFT_267012 [Aspergillus ibericus CBS 121593]|uniref:Uncharacterized protein n=1 Tax=Aspergillus ibericus CBS 121593 TaxID=1448316 RepID=A0A395H9T9_9EURO|nr:hypothetical protein BO80DRAFT_267012 [Aspergillus ibericus CBS 121593]RAL03668.1 hypothetical protein BO80DRAFT_267012 [Aspergillus ibericus CBS 121593]
MTRRSAKSSLRIHQSLQLNLERHDHNKECNDLILWYGSGLGLGLDSWLHKPKMQGYDDMVWDDVVYAGIVGCVGIPITSTFYLGAHLTTSIYFGLVQAD